MATKISPFKYNLERNYNGPLDLSSVHSSYTYMAEYVDNSTAGWYSGQILSVDDGTTYSAHPYYTYVANNSKYIVPLMTASDQQTSYDSLYSYITASYAYSLSYTRQAYTSLSTYISDTYTAAVNASKAYVETYTYNKIAEVIDSAPEAFDTLKEIADWITYDTSGTEELLNRVSNIEQTILDDEITISASINDLDDRLRTNTDDLAYFSNVLATTSYTLSYELYSYTKNLDNGIRMIGELLNQCYDMLTSDISDLRLYVDDYVSTEVDNLTTEIQENELTVSAALNDLNERTNDIAQDITELSETTTTYGQILGSHMQYITNIGAPVSYTSDTSKYVYTTIGQKTYAHINSIDVSVAYTSVSTLASISEDTYGLSFTPRTYTSGLVTNDIVAALNADEEVITDQLNNLSYGVVNNALLIDDVINSYQYCSLSDDYTIGEIFKALLDAPVATPPTYSSISGLNNTSNLVIDATQVLDDNGNNAYYFDCTNIKIKFNNVANTEANANTIAGQTKGFTTAYLTYGNNDQSQLSATSYINEYVYFGNNNGAYIRINPELGNNKIFSALTVDYQESNPAYYTQLANKNVYIMCNDDTAKFTAGTINQTINYSIPCKYPYYYGYGNDLPTLSTQLTYRGFYDASGTTNISITGTTDVQAIYFYVAFPKDLYDREAMGTQGSTSYYWEGVNNSGRGPLESDSLSYSGVTTTPILINNKDYLLSYIKHTTNGRTPYFEQLISVHTKITKKNS